MTKQFCCYFPCNGFVHHPLHEVVANGEEQMDREIGINRAIGLRESGCIPSIACRATGQNTRWMKLWLVPVSWKSMTEADWKAFQVSMQGEAGEDEINYVQDFAADMLNDEMPLVASGSASSQPTSTSPAGAGTAPVKKEFVEKTEREKMAERVVLYKDNRDATLKRYQDMELVAKKIRTNVNSKELTPFKQTFLTSLEKHIKDLGKTLNALMYVEIVHKDKSLRE